LVPNTLLWEGLARLLSTTSYKPLGCSTSLNDLVQDVDFDPKRAMFIVGWDSGARAMNGSAALVELRQLRERYPEAKLIVMSAVCDFDSVVASLHAGADGYVLSSMTCEMLTKSFDLVVAGETILPAEFTRAFSAAKGAVQSLVPNPAPPTPKEALLSEVQNRPSEMREMRKLSGRELAIMSHLREGDSNKIIARRIGLAEATVKTHVKAILRKVGVKNRTQAALWAITNLEVAAPDTDTNQLELQPEPPYQSNGGSNGAHATELPPLRRDEFDKLSRHVTRQRSRATADQ
jgi:two-component system nitrate/nitrite response regulator NarL